MNLTSSDDTNLNLSLSLHVSSPNTSVAALRQHEDGFSVSPDLPPWVTSPLCSLTSEYELSLGIQKYLTLRLMGVGKISRPCQ